MIELRDVRLEIAGHALLRDLDVRIPAGEFVAVLGANGAGKTTLLRAIAGVHGHTGSIVVDGAEVAHLSPAARARHIAYVTSDDVMTDALRVRDMVAIGRFPHHHWWQWSATGDDDAAVDAALNAVRATELVDRLFTTLSSGERQRVWIAMGLAQATPVLLLDEPTSHLDVRVAHEILALLRDLSHDGKTIVCVLHDLNDAAAYADRLLLLGCGRQLAFGAPAEVLESGLMHDAYGIAMETVHTARGVRVFPAR